MNNSIDFTFQVNDMGHTVILSAKPFLGGTQYGGFLYFRHTFQVSILSWLLTLLCFGLESWSGQLMAFCLKRTILSKNVSSYSSLLSEM